MSIKVQTDFIRKTSVRVIVYVYNDDGALAEATSVDISIVDPKGIVVIDEAAMEPSATGIYEYLYATTDDNAVGSYQIECDITDGTYHTYVHGHFTLKAGINEG